jgi:hypothetical protein
MTAKTTTAIPAFRENQTQPDLGFPADRMLEAKVALSLADLILSLAGARKRAIVRWEPIRNRRSAATPRPALTGAATTRSRCILDPTTTSWSRR